MKLYVVLINLDRSYSIDYATYLFLLSLFTVSCLILFLNEKSRHFSCETCGLSRTEKRHENANSGVIVFRLFNVKIRNVIAVHTVMSVRRAWSHDAHIKRARPSDKEKVLKRDAESRIAEHECVYIGLALSVARTSAKHGWWTGVERWTDKSKSHTTPSDNGDTCNSIYYKSLRALDVFCCDRSGQSGVSLRRQRLDLVRSMYIMSDACRISDGQGRTI